MEDWTLQDKQRKQKKLIRKINKNINKTNPQETGDKLKEDS